MAICIEHFPRVTGRLPTHSGGLLDTDGGEVAKRGSQTRAVSDLWVDLVEVGGGVKWVTTRRTVTTPPRSHGKVALASQ